MKNFSEQLKSYWKTIDLAFIATFKRVNKNADFFILKRKEILKNAQPHDKRK